MKFVERGHFTDPDAAARKLVEIANAAKAVQDGRIHVRSSTVANELARLDLGRPAPSHHHMHAADHGASIWNLLGH
jgi:hypothetical protein